MKKLLCLLAIPAMVFAGDYDMTKSVVVTGGSYAETNSANEQFEISGIGFKLASAVTNTFSIAVARYYAIPATRVTVVTTNSTFTSGNFEGVVETNYQYYGPTVTLYTNTVFSASVTNSVAFQWYDSLTSTKKLPDGMTIEQDDIITYTWSGYTNTIYFIRNAYKIKQ